MRLVTLLSFKKDFKDKKLLKTKRLIVGWLHVCVRARACVCVDDTAQQAIAQRTLIYRTYELDCGKLHLDKPSSGRKKIANREPPTIHRKLLNETSEISDRAQSYVPSEN